MPTNETPVRRDDPDDGRAVSETSRTTGEPGQPDYGGGGEVGLSGDFGGEQSAGLSGEGRAAGDRPDGTTPSTEEEPRSGDEGTPGARPPR